MSDMDINRMDFKQLRNEVQFLRDELAIFRRKYEDMIYNLDSDNFSSHIIKEKDGMKAQIKLTAEEISTKVSNEDFESAISQTAERISSVVVESIDLSQAIRVNSPDDFEDISEIYSVLERDGEGNVVGETFYYYNAISHKWETVKSSETIHSLFEQTSDGFKLKGNVSIDGSCILTESLTFNSSDRPVDVQYSSDGKDGNWHYGFVSGTDEFMRMKIGATWTGAIKIAAKDGERGPQGPSGTISYNNVYSILETTYGIERTYIDGESIAAPTIYSAQLYSPDIYGENLVLVTENASNSSIYNNLYLTPTSMYLENAYGDNALTKFYLDLGSDTSNSSIKMRLGAGSGQKGKQALNLEKYEDEIRIGTYVEEAGNMLTNFAGMIITPSTGAVTFTGTVQAVAVFG